MIEFRDRIAKENGIDMLVYTNEEGVKAGINPFDNGSAYTDIMKTQALKQALTKYGFTAAFGGDFTMGILGMLALDLVLIVIGVICTLFLDDDSELAQKAKKKGKISA